MASESTSSAKVMASDAPSSRPSSEIDHRTFFTDSSMMIAYERALETERGQEALFTDPFARQLATDKGEELSAAFEAYATPFGFAEWPEFHKTWTVVRTKFIDNTIEALASDKLQMVNLGAGLDTRACRLKCYRHFKKGFEVDLDATIAPKAKFFAQIGAVPLCENIPVAADLTKGDVLETGLAAAGFDTSTPSIFLAEGLIMYLGAKDEDFLAAVSGVAAKGSTFILNFLGVEPQVARPGAQSSERLRALLEANGWTNLRFSHFGDETLNFGRYKEGMPPNISFSFVVCTKE